LRRGAAISWFENNGGSTLVGGAKPHAFLRVRTPLRATEGQGVNPAQPASSRSTLGILRDLVIIVTIFVYFSGFTYRYFYLTYLGIPPSSVDVSYNSILVFAFSVVVVNIWWAIAIFALTILIGIAVRTRDRVRVLFTSSPAFFVSLLALPAFIVLHVASLHAARVAAIQVMLGESDSVSRISLSLKPSRRNYPQAFLNAVNHDKAILMGVSGERLYLLIPPENIIPGSRNLPDLSMYVVPVADVAHYKTLISGCSDCVNGDSPK
jgi:hypothetical protein